MNATQQFLSQQRFAVVGASTDRTKYGNKVLRCYLQHEREVVPVNPKDATVEGLAAVKSLSEIQPPPEAVSVITPPKITEAVVEEAGRLGIKHLWMQPGAESDAAVRAAKESGANVVAGGPCILVSLRFRDG